MVEKTFRLRDLINQYGSIGALRNAPKVRAKLAFELAILAGQVTAKVRDFEEARNARVKHYGVIDKDGNLTIPNDKKMEFNKEIEELLDTEVIIKAEPVSIPANFEMDGMVGVLSDWSDFLTFKE